jgi:putative membrane-bound dehydrogenase-like protein
MLLQAICRQLLFGIKAAAMACLLGSTAIAADTKSPLAPADALASFQLDGDLQIELVACEPEVIDPVALRFDEDGRLWVVEMRDYPHGPAKGRPPLSKIKVLDDRDGDGRFETSHVFADELLFPTGLQPWRSGLIVTLAAEVIYLEDTDGDGRADLRETWYRGFTAENPQLRANHPRFGIDNRIYVANGLLGGTIENRRIPGSESISISGRDFRFNPRDGACEAISGNGQFGLTFDAFGRRFVCSNRQPLDHIVLEGRYLARNSLLAAPSVQTAVAAAGEASHVYPLTSAWTTSNLHAGQFTAACGIEIDRGSALGASYGGNSFTCEPTGSLIHREVIKPLGATFQGNAAVKGKEFLASSDSWFRPVNLEWGPDGALYLADMYRAVIEHPQFMPSELQQRPDLRLGDDRGRIYRIVPKQFKRPSRPSLSSANTAELVAFLGHPHSWYRETVARLLYERQDLAAVEQLEALAKEHADPITRIAALWTLDGLGHCTPRTIATALADANPRVREQGVMLSEIYLNSDAELLKKVILLADDADERLRFQTALSLGGVASAECVAPLAKIARAAIDDWTRLAIASAQPDRIAPILLALLNSKQAASFTIDSSQTRTVRTLAGIVGSRREPGELAPLLELACGTEAANHAARVELLLGLAEGGIRRGGSLVTTVAGLTDAEVLTASLTRLFDTSAVTALSEDAPVVDRTQALELLAHARHAPATKACLQLATECPQQAIRTRAIAALAQHPDDTVAAALLTSYPQQTPQVRSAIRDALSVRPEAALQFVAAVRDGRIARAELGAAGEARLTQHRDERVRTLAATVLTTEVPAERKAVLAEYQAALELTPDALAGKALFRQHCATCHHIGDVGVDVAPDISDSRVKSQSQLLTDILHPNQAIDNNYVSYTVAMADGNIHTGLIAAETASSVTLRQPENKTLSLLRVDIETLKSNGVSLMPEGFEKHLSHQQMADLIGFVKNWRYLERPIPGTIGAETSQ